jgi:hypothetical protein
VGKPESAATAASVGKPESAATAASVGKPESAATAASVGTAAGPATAASEGREPAEATLAAKAGRGPIRAVGATVILANGALAAYLARGDRQLLAFLPGSEPERSKTGRAIGRALIERARDGAGGDQRPHGMLIEEIDGIAPVAHALTPYLVEAGFVAGAMGLQSTVNTGSLVARPRHVLDI